MDFKRTLEAGKSARANPVLKDYLATFMEPLTLEKWEKIYSQMEGEPPLASPC